MPKKNFEQWSMKEHEELIISLKEEGKGSYFIARKLIQLYNVEQRPDSLARLIRKFFQWREGRQASKEESPGESLKTYLIGGCFHFPFEDKGLFQSFLNIIKYLGDDLTGICLNGDFIDLMSLSSHAKGQNILKGINLEVEYESGLNALLEIENAIQAKKVRRMFNYGNHEDRYFRHMANSDNSKYGTALKSPTEGLKLHELGYEVNEDWKDGFFTIEGAVDVFHGIYCNKHTAAKHLETYQRSCVFNHTHRVQTYYSNGLAAHNSGTMADLKNKAFAYMPRAQKMQWNNAFTVVRVSGVCVHIQTIVAQNGQFCFDGRIF